MTFLHLFFQIFFYEGCEMGSACSIHKNTAPPWMFFTFLKLHKSFQIAHDTNDIFSI